MPNIIQYFNEELTNELGNLKTDKDKDHVNSNNLLKKIHCLNYDVHNNNIDMDLLNKVRLLNIIDNM